MSFSGFEQADFDVFKIDGLDERMDALKSQIRPKLEDLGRHFAPTLSSIAGDEMHYHVAKHARRTKNPPKDTWVAFASNSRGYKMLPHFQIGLWETHVFIWFAVIYEAPEKEAIGKKLEENIHSIYTRIPKDFYWSIDHMKPEARVHSELSKEDLLSMFKRLQTVKKAEILCGLNIPREEAVKLSGEEMLSKIEFVFKEILPLYKLA
ncbi:YktB family protein [Mesobacillus selenatarsenatis]|uniref:UPF0637 protein SAMD00020551_2773 n=1 Tax=Mesobacillus selenatarsenatis (strain DSM 18680 / JCM 14380 / FERM P-15431 / SF-1) TaxID=1321606 RepID=A0A0A8X3Q9_MESS1|nr:DUF1054 domain-containing protein [Mesobacillus selenatarsenatis]GAM14620.1 hypothetical protein SAMD00020551_2773 [Mesobacillus selenatarsenatis SF-1]